MVPGRPPVGCGAWWPPCLLLMPLTGVAADDGDPAMNAIEAMMRYHQLLRINRSLAQLRHRLSATFTVVSEKPGEDNSVFKAHMFRRDAEEKFVLVYLEPNVRRGQGYLQVDDNLWFYDPESRKFSHSSLRESLADSEARNSDLTQSSLAEDYAVDDGAVGRLGRYDVHVLESERAPRRSLLPPSQAVGAAGQQSDPQGAELQPVRPAGAQRLLSQVRTRGRSPACRRRCCWWTS